MLVQCLDFVSLGRGGGIRTHASFDTPSGFQDRPLITTWVPLQIEEQLITVAPSVLRLPFQPALSQQEHPHNNQPYDCGWQLLRHKP